MESKAIQYERQAKEPEEKVESVRDTEAKRAWREIAAHWHAMAAQARRNGW
jgi:hypothetical protein